MFALVGLAIGGAANRDLLDAVLWALAPLIWALAVLLRVLVLVIAVIAFILVSPILWLLSGTDFAPIRSTPQGTEPGLQERVREEVERTTDVPDPIRYLVVSRHPDHPDHVTRAVCTAPAPASGTRRRTKSAPRCSAATDLLAALGNRLKRALGLLRPDADPLADPQGGPALGTHSSGSRGVHRPVAHGSRARILRAPGRTAREHAAHIATALPRNEVLTPEVARLTGLYDAARYGASPATEAEAAAAQDALAHDRAHPPTALTATR